MGTANPAQAIHNGVTDFDRLMARGHDASASAYAYAFDLLAIDDRDVRHEPLEQRKAALAKLLRKAKPGIRLSEHLTGPGDTIFEHACRLGLEGMCVEAKVTSKTTRLSKA